MHAVEDGHKECCETQCNYVCSHYVNGTLEATSDEQATIEQEDGTFNESDACCIKDSISMLYLNIKNAAQRQLDAFSCLALTNLSVTLKNCCNVPLSIVNI